jgi:hypothetical protein
LIHGGHYNFRYYFLLGAAILFSLLAGHPQTTVYTSYLLIAFWLFLSFVGQTSTPRSGLIVRLQRVAREIPKLALVYALVTTAAGVVILPAAQNWQLSRRSKQPYSSVAELSLPVSGLLGLFFPNYFGKVAPSDLHQPYWGYTASERSSSNWRDMQYQYWEFGMYAGQLSIVALLVLLTSRNFLRANVVPAFFCGAAILSVWFILGDHGGLFTWLYHVLPGISLFRGPSKMACVLDCAAAAVTAFFVDAIISRERLPLQKCGAILVAGYASWLIVMWLVGDRIFSQFSDAHRLGYSLTQTVIGFAILLLAVLAAVVVTTRRPRFRRWAIWCLVIVTFCDLYLAHGSFHKGQVSPSSYYADRFDLVPKLRALVAEQGPLRLGQSKDGKLYEESLFPRNFAYLHDGIEMREGYTSFLLEDWGRLQDITNEAAKIDVQNIGVLADRSEHSRIVVLRLNTNLLPRAKFYSQIRFYDSTTQVFDDLEAGAIDYHNVVAVVRPDKQLQLPDRLNFGPPRHDDRVEIVRSSPGRYTLRYAVHSPGVIFISETFYPGWLVTPNRGYEIVNSFGTFLGVVVPTSGTGEINVTFKPIIFVAGLIVTGSATLVSILIYLVCRRRERACLTVTSKGPAPPPAA